MPHLLAAAGGPVVPPPGVELLAVFLGGLSGALYAVQRRFPVTGELALGVASALGGGLLRDVLLSRLPVSLSGASYLVTAVAAAVVGFTFGSVLHQRLQLALDVLDPIWMGLFAVLGSDAATAAGTSPTGAVLVGCVAAVGGGVLRDILAGEAPQLVLPGPVNYLAGITGSIVYTTAVTLLPVDRAVAAWTTVVLVTALRLTALRYGVMAPAPPDLSVHLAASRRALKRRRNREGRQQRVRRRGGEGP